MVDRNELVRNILARRFTDETRNRIPPRASDTPVPLTAAQAGIWFASRLYLDSPEYNIFDSMLLHRRLTPDQIQRSALTLVERHDVLRLGIDLIDGAPHQYERPPRVPEISWYDWRGLSTAEAVQKTDEVVGRATRVVLGADLSPLFRITVIAQPGDRTLVLLVVHHVIADYVTQSVLLEELATLLVGGTLPPPPPVGFLDYAAWSADQTDPVRVDEDLQWWLQKLSDSPRLDLPFDRPRPANPTRRGHAVAFNVPTSVTARLSELATAHGTTPFVMFLVVYDLMLARLSEVRDLVVGTTLLGRDHPDTERMPGCFVQTVPLRVEVEDDATYLQLVVVARRALSEAQDHHAVSFDRVVDALAGPRELGVHPVFQTYFNFLSEDAPPVSGVEIDPTAVLNYGSTKWDMSISLWQHGSVVQAIMETSADLFTLDSVELHRDLFLSLCDAVAAEPDSPVADLRLMEDEPANPEGQLHQVRVPYATLTAPFEEQAARTPDAVAIEAGEDRISYAEFDRRTVVLAQVLCGGAPGRVALVMERSVEMLVTIYAVARAGAAYVPLDSSVPDNRLEFMLDDTDPDLVVVDSDLVERVRRVAAGRWTVLAFDELTEVESSEAALPEPKGGGARVSHLLYTSGSTGQPKAVACTVATAIADIEAMQQSLDYDSDDRVLFKTFYGFDTSLWEIFWPLYAGARIVVCPPGTDKDPERLAETIDRHEVTVVVLTPTVLLEFLDVLDRFSVVTLRYILTGGEMVSPLVCERFRAQFTGRSRSTRLINGYGPTETACIAHAFVEADAGAVVPVGRPHPHVRVHVLDRSGHPVPPGVPGEGWISSYSVAQSYHRRAALTAERFTVDPFGPPGVRMYRTGDRVRLRGDGTLEILGRLDGQVKIRGLRVELGEVEAAANRLSEVADCVVVTVGDSAETRLAVFARLRPGATLTAGDLRRGIAQSLPRHMVPSTVQLVDRYPTTMNGKLDRAALRRMWEPTSIVPDALAAPADSLEAVLSEIFAEVLGLAGVGVTDGFFDLGGHSMQVFRVLSACERRLGIRPEVADVFAAPSVRQLAARLRTVGRRRTGLFPLRPRPGRPLIVFVHAVSGSAMPFQAVADEFDEGWSCYGVQTEEFVVGEARRSLDQLAAAHVAAVDTVRGLSPIHLVGWSMGGSVAVEMARQWREVGVEVAGLVLLDAWLPPGTAANHTDAALLEAAMRAPQLDDLDLAATALADDPEELDRLRRTTDANAAAYLDHHLAPLDQPAHLLRVAEPAADILAALPPVWRNPTLGWDTVLGPVEVGSIAGSHQTLVRPQHAAGLATAVRAALESHDVFDEL